MRNISDKARDADVALVYYAGDGVEIDGTTYLMPTDEAVPLNRILTVTDIAEDDF